MSEAALAEMDQEQMAAAVRRGRGGIVLKSPREIGLMRRAGALVFRVLAEVEQRVAVGVTTRELNELAERRIAEAGAEPLFKGVVNPQARFPFPAALCISVNREVVHGIPTDRALSEGDIVSVDCGVRLDGYCGDAARTFAVGAIAPDVSKLLDVTREALNIAVRHMRVGSMWSEVAERMQAHVEDNGFSVVRDFVGHGIGQEMHEEPKVPNYHDRKQSRSDFRLEPNMTLAVEPMVTMGTHEVCYADADRWTVVTRDGRCAAHFEDTIAVTENGAEVLTRD